MAVQAVRLADEGRRLAAQLQAARERLVLAREEERRRLRRDLHDGLGPRLAALTLRLDTARDALAADPRADALLGDLAERTEEAVADIRRLVHGLRPPALDDLGLIGAIRQAADGYGPAGPQITVEAPAPLPPLPAAVEVAAYRIATEAMTNVARLIVNARIGGSHDGGTSPAHRQECCGDESGRVWRQAERPAADLLHQRADARAGGDDPR